MKAKANLSGAPLGERLRQARASLEQKAPLQEAEVLRARARAAAGSARAGEAPEAVLEVLEFVLAGERYALETGCLREVTPLKDFTPLPGTPPFLLGIVHLRGRIISIVDLRKFFDLPAAGIGDLNKLLVLYSERMEFGVLADAVLGIRSLPVTSIQPSLPTLEGIRSRYLKGVTGDGMAILDGTRLLEDPSLVVNEGLDG
jgi:purine-binding chemotaxis protein CheW